MLARDLGIDGIGLADLCGRGGSATVYKAMHRDGYPVAVKVLKSTLGDAASQKAIDRETRALERIGEHDGIVPIIGSGITSNDEPYLVMPLLVGSLQDRIDNDGPISWELTTSVMAQASDAVAHAHLQGVLHRDLKPANILVDENGKPLVADFGIARITDATAPLSSQLVATPSYMAPELLERKAATEAADVYSLGATIAALLEGTAPFTTENHDPVAAVITSVLNDSPPDLASVDAPDALKDLVQRTMAKDPTERPASARDLANELRTLADTGGLGVTGTIKIPTKYAVQIPNIEEPTEGSNKNRRVALGILGVALVALVTVAGIGLSMRNTDDPSAATALPESTATALPEPTATALPEPTATALPEPTATALPESTATALPEPTATALPEPTATALPEPTATALRDLTAAIAEQGGIRFITASANLVPDALPIIEQAANVIEALPDGTQVEIAGHTDTDGSEDLNLQLSEARALAVRDLLVAAGIDRDTLTAVGYGETRLLINPEQSAADKTANRRIEFTTPSNQTGPVAVAVPTAPGPTADREEIAAIPPAGTNGATTSSMQLQINVTPNPPCEMDVAVAASGFAGAERFNIRFEPIRPADHLTDPASCGFPRTVAASEWARTDGIYSWTHRMPAGDYEVTAVASTWRGFVAEQRNEATTIASYPG